MPNSPSLADALSAHHVPLRGESVLLEPLAVSHSDALWEAADRVGDSGALTTVPRSRESMGRYVIAALAAKKAGGALPYAIVALERRAVVGSTRFASIERWDFGENAAPRASVVHAVEIGWTWLAADAQRTVVNTESKLLLLTHAFEVLGVERVMLKTDVRNTRSRAAIERIGGRLEGILRRHMPAADGGVRDTAMYSIVVTEWPEVQSSLRARLRKT